ncbi:MAG TPA: DUF6485 family protein [Myxococcota bacterium]|nr:DUF6485 family protein [Myxococcota bacterium]HQK51267.1 DUF6485 family protein [Myxococcota bacterium]
MKECKSDRNLRRCTCTWTPCSRKGVCCDCLADHWSRHELPGCLFPPEDERTYDRSLSRFIEAWRARGY